MWLRHASKCDLYNEATYVPMFLGKGVNIGQCDLCNDVTSSPENNIFILFIGPQPEHDLRK